MLIIHLAFPGRNIDNIYHVVQILVKQSLVTERTLSLRMQVEVNYQKVRTTKEIQSFWQAQKRGGKRGVEGEKRNALQYGFVNITASQCFKQSGF